jgi:hypothetical protein
MARADVLVRPELFADSVDEELDAAAARAHIHIEVLVLDEQLSDFAQDAPIRAFVKALSPDVVERTAATRTCDRIDRCGRWVIYDGRYRFEFRIRHPGSARAALPAGIEAFIH